MACSEACTVCSRMVSCKWSARSRRQLHLRADFVLQLRHLLRRLLHLIANDVLQARDLVGSLLHLAVYRVLEVIYLVGGVANLFLNVMLGLLGPVFGLLEVAQGTVNLIEPGREFLFEFDGGAFENFLRGRLQRRLNLLRAVGDHLIRLARHLLLLRGE